MTFIAIFSIGKYQFRGKKREKKQIREQNPLCQEFFLLALIIFINNKLIFRCRLKKFDSYGDF